jgi:hypothetical protein
MNFKILNKFLEYLKDNRFRKNDKPMTRIGPKSAHGHIELAQPVWPMLTGTTECVSGRSPCPGDLWWRDRRGLLGGSRVA